MMKDDSGISGEGERFSDLVHLVREEAGKSSVSLQSLLQIVGPKGHAFLGMFLCLPFLQPIPLPGLSTPFGLTLAILGVFTLLYRPPYVPQRLGKMKLDGSSVLKICSGLEALLTRLEHLVKPRGRGVCRQLWLKRLNGCLFLLHGALLSLPLPIPFTNTLPAISIFLISWGTLEEDYLAISLGHLTTLITLAFFTALVVLPYLASVKLLES